MPSTIEQVHRELSPRGLTVLAVNIAESRDAVVRWVRDTKLTARVLLDRERAVTRAYQVTATPTVFLVDRAGRMVGRAAGPRPWLGDKGRALLDALLGAPGR